MSSYQYYEVDGAVFRRADGKMQVYKPRSGEWGDYTGDRFRVTRLSNPMTLAEVNTDMGYNLTDDSSN